jgi:hypothetical protein
MPKETALQLAATPSLPSADLLADLSAHLFRAGLHGNLQG